MKTLILLLSVLFTTMSFTQVPSYVPANGLLGWWPFNGNANDESGTGNNGTVNGATLTTDRFGVANKAYDFDGVSNFIQLNSILISGNQSRSISFFYKISNNPITDYSAISFGGNSSNCSQAGGDYEIGFFNSNGNFTRADGTCSAVYASSINDSEWHHVVFNYDLINGSTFESINIYIDGAYIAAANYNGSTSINTLTLSSLVFGKSNKEARFFNGKLDDIGIWNRALTDCEIQNLYTSTNPTNLTSQTSCDSYTWNGTTYTASGVYTGTTANCVTESLNLTITPSSTNTTPISACNSYTWNGTTYTTSGVYTGTTSNCVTQALNLTINTNTSSSISQTALDSYTWPVNSQTYTTTGAYTAVIPNAAGCDSTITLNLTMSFTGINDLSDSKLTIYPNPTNGDFTITGLELVGTVSSLTLTDMNGKVVKVLDAKATKFSMSSIKPGVYFLNIISENKQEVLKIVKE